MTATIERAPATPSRVLPPPPPAARDDRVPSWWLAAVSALLYLACLAQQAGSVVADTKLNVALRPGAWLARTFELWQPGSDFGFVQNQAVGYLFPMGAFFWVGDHLAPVWVVQRCWTGSLFVVALWGLARLADELQVGRPASRLVAAVTYALSPFFVARGGNTSALVLGGVLLPWILLPLVRASRGGSLRRCGLASGVALLAVGGINGAVALTVLLTPIAWLATRRRDRQLLVLTAWWSLGVVLAVCWWLVPLLFQGRYGFDFLPYTERANVTTGYASTPEILRGVADWLQYLHLGGPWIRAGWTLVSEPLLIVLTGLVAALGLFGVARRDLPHRGFAVLSLLLGVVVMAGGYGTALGNPAAGLFRAALDGPAAAFRNVYKVQPVVLLPLALGTAHALEVARSRLVLRGSGRRSHRVRRTVATALALAVAGVVVAGAAPLTTGRLTSDGAFAAVPSWWKDLAAWQSTQPAASRLLIVPGATTGGYSWGTPQDEPLDVYANRPYAVRSLVPYGAPEQARLLDAVDSAVAHGGDPGLPAYLTRAGLSYVVARNDLDWSRWNDPAPPEVDRALVASGLHAVKTFGPTLAELPGGLAASAGALPGDSGSRLHALVLYSVGPVTAAPVSLVRSYPTATAVGVSGGPASLLTLAHDGVLGPDQATLSAADVVAAGDTAPTPTRWVGTDDLVRRQIDPGLTNTNQSYPLLAGEPAAAGGRNSGPSFLSYPAQGHEGTGTWSGGIAGVTASSYGSWLFQLPEAGPAAALDGDPTTAWATGTAGTSQGQWLQVSLRAPTQVDAITVSLLEDGPWRPAVTSLRVVTDAGSRTTTVRPDESVQTLQTAPGLTSSVRVYLQTVTGETATSAGAGIRELTVPGVTGTFSVALPSDVPTGSNPTYVLRRSSTNVRNVLRQDPEPQLSRILPVDTAGSREVGATLAPLPGAALLSLLDRAQAALGSYSGATPLTITASSTFGSLPEYRSANLLDGNPLTGWSPQPSTPPTLLTSASGVDPTRQGRGSQVAAGPQSVDAAPHLDLAWGAPRTLHSIGVTVAAGFSAPASLRLTTPSGQSRVVPVAADGTVAAFAPLTTSRLTVEFLGITTRTVRTSLGTAAMPLGLTGLDLPELHDLLPVTLDAAAPVTLACGAGPTVSVGGTAVSFSLRTTVEGIVSGIAERAQPCATPDVDVPAGNVAVTSAAGSGSYAVADVLLTPVRTAPAPAAAVRTTTVTSWGATKRSVDIAAGPASYLAVAETSNVGWQATLDGHRLAPVRLDGWQQGFVVPAGAGGTVHLLYGPQHRYQLVLIAGLALAGLLIVLVLLPGRRRRGPVLPAGPLPRRALWALCGAVGIWTGGALVLLVPVLLLLDAALARRSGSTGRPFQVLPWVAVAGMAAAAAFAAGAAGRAASAHVGAFGWPAQTAATLAVLAVCTASARPAPKGPS